MAKRKNRRRAAGGIEALEGRTLLAASPFTVVALTDSQYYVENFPGTFQTQWIAGQKAARNVAFVAHQGDLLRRGYSSAQVAVARAAFTTLETAGIPYGVSIGNHDFDNQFDDLDHHVSSASFTAAFGAPRLAAQGAAPAWGADLAGHNTYQVIDAGGRQFLMMSLEWEAPDAALAWAQGVINGHRHLPVILSTHEYLRGITRTTSPLDPAANSGQQIWDEFVKLNPQVFMVLSGHTGTEYHLTSTNNAGLPVFELAADYEGRADGGSGWLQFMEFVPDANVINVKTYSPTLNQWETDATSEFSLPMNFATRLSFAAAGVPIANDDVLDTLPGQTFTGNVVTNDYEPDRQALTASLISGPASGALTLNPDGTFTYTPNAGFRGNDSFRYTVTDGVTGTSNQATVTLRVNSAPAASADAVRTPQDTAITVNVVANDVDADAADVLRPILTSLPPNGAVFVNSDGTFTYTPDPKFVGTDSFTYRVTDGKVASAPVTVTVTVRPNRPVYDYPIAEQTVIGTRTGTYAATFASNEGAEEAIVEALSGGSSQLDHRWTFNVTGGNEVIFALKAKRSYGLNEYQLDYSTNGGSTWAKFTPIVPASSLDVTRTNYDADEPYQMWLMPASTRGNVVVRVTETNGTDSILDTFTVDEVFIRSATAFPVISIAKTSDGSEGGGPATFTVSRTGSTLNAIDVAYALGGTASAADYQPVSGIVTIPAGATSATLAVSPVVDQIVEGQETLTATIQPGLAYDVAAASATATIDDARFVIHISVDGLRPDAVTTLGAAALPNFYRLRNEGAFTDNARADFDYTETLPNHTTQLTGRPVVGPGGHSVTFNYDPGTTIHQSAGAYVPSVFDVAHDNGLRTGLYTSKDKFAFFDRSWNAVNGVPDTTGADNGRDKIDAYLYDGSSQSLTDAFAAAMRADPLGYSLLHWSDPDVVGHASGWMGTAYLDAVKRMDALLGQVLGLVEGDPRLAGNTHVVLTADHGGTGTGHADELVPEVYTLPFYAWGPGVSAGADLYQLNPASRAAPGTSRPDNAADPQPIRNGDAANLALDLLGLPPVPTSRFNARSDLSVSKADAAPFTVIVLPDTQYYAESYPEIFDAQAQWIAEHVGSDNIAFVTHVGDVVDNGAASALEWQRADAAMDRLDGLVPYSVSLGNHDYDVVSDHSAATAFAQWFGASRYAGQGWYGGSTADGRNHYQLFTAGGAQYLHLNLEWEASDAVIGWAQGVIDAHPGVPTILTTHAYLDTSGRSTSATSGDGNSGETIFQELVRPNAQIFMTLGGHNPGEYRQTSANAAGSDVFEMLADYQNRASGGEGWLRVLRFDPERNRVDVKTYSPWLDRYEADANSQFSLTLDFNRRFNFAGAPTAALAVPQDGGAGDLDPSPGAVTVSGDQPVFRVQLSDVGQGVDDASVTAQAVRMVKDGTSFVAYAFAYDAATDTITITPTGASFGAGTYEIYLSADVAKVRDLDGNAMAAETLRVRINPSTAQQVTTSFQQRAGGYAGTVDTQLSQASPGTSYATATSLTVDNDEPSGSGNDAQVLLRFDAIFGAGAGQIPAGATIDSAVLELQVTNPGHAMNLHRVLRGWSATDTWSAWGGGVQADGVEARATADVGTGAIGATGKLSIDVTASVAAWLADPSFNFGWVLLPTNTDGVDFYSAEGTTPPRLVVTYTPAGTPTAAGDIYAVSEDATLAVDAPGVLANDTDPDADPLTAVLADGPAHGGLTLNADGSFTYTPFADFSGADSFTYRAFDGTTYSEVATVNITVTAVNDEPVAGDDTYSTAEDAALVIAAPGVLANDTDADGNTLSAVLVAGPAHGTLTLNSDGSFSYTPAQDYHGPDGFSYRVGDGSADGNVATVGLTVAAVNDAPVARDDAFGTAEDTALTIDSSQGVLVNDTDAEGDALSARLVSWPHLGTLSLSPDGSFIYTPHANANGTDSFTYVAGDGAADSAPATVTITISPVADAPVAADDDFSTDEDTVLAGSVIANDSDPDGDTLTVSLELDSGPANGTLVLLADGSFTYTPAANFSGTDTFVYRVSDGAASSSATATITVRPVNDAPAAAGDSFTVGEDTVLTVAAPGVLGNDSDAEGAALSAVFVAGPAHGSLTLNADGSFTYTPAADFAGEDSFTYAASDGSAPGAPATVTLTVNAVNDAPVAADDSYSIDQDAALDVVAPGLLTNDGDVDGDALTAGLVSGPTNGTLALNPDGSFTYTPDSGFYGADSFTYLVSDGALSSAAATVHIDVKRKNAAPVAGDDSYLTDEDMPLSVLAASGTLTNDTDADKDAFTAVLVSGPANGTLAFNPDGSFAYAPGGDFNGLDSFTYRVVDALGAASEAATVLITVNPVNDAPAAGDDHFTGTEDAAISGNVLANDGDADGDPLSVRLLTGPVHGTLSLGPDGSFTYTPDADYSGPDGFTYEAADAEAARPATVNLTVTAVNDVPVAAGESYSTDEDTTLVVAAPGVLTNDEDADGDALSSVLTSGPAHGMLTLSADGSFTYSPAKDYSGPDSFSYAVSDGSTASASVTVTISVAPVNDAPVAVDDVATVVAGNTLVGDSVLANDGDVEGDPLSAEFVSGPANGTLTLSADGTYVYTPIAGFTGTDGFTYVARDPSGALSDPAAVAITVAPAGTDDHALSEATTFGAASGLAATGADDDVYETIREQNYGKTKHRLSHSWEFDVTGGGRVTFYLQAHHDSAVEGFTFDYSLDRVTWTPMLTLATAADDDGYQTFDLPAATSGQVWVRVLDTNGNDASLDTVYVDHMFFRSTAAGAPPVVSITASDPVASETGNDSGEFTVTRAGGDTSADLVVNYTVGGTASAGDDYQALAGQVTIPAGSASATFSLVPIDDAAVEEDETVIVSLSPSGTYALGTGSSATVTIADDDTAQPTVPAAPTGLSAAASSTWIDLSWTDNATDESGYRIERSADGLSFTPVATVGADVTTFSDTGLAASTTYHYRVLAYNGAGDSGYSNVASATTPAATDTTPPTVPTGLAVTETTSTSVSLAWAASTDDVSVAGYEVWRDGALVGTTTSTGYTDTGVVAGTSYVYAVKAYDAAGNVSQPSGTATAVTPAAAAVPAAPVNLVGAVTQKTKVKLSWQDASTDETGFNVYVSSDGSSWSAVPYATVAPKTNSGGTVQFTTGALEKGTTWYFRVSAFNDSGESALSDVVAVSL